MRVVTALTAAAACAVVCGPFALAQRPASCAVGLNTEHSDLPIPSLTPPPGVTTLGVTRGGDPANFRCSLRYDSRLAAIAIAGHVNAQMTMLGWKASASGGDGALLLTQFSGSSSGGAALSAVAIVAPLDGTTYHDVSIHIVQLEVPSTGTAVQDGDAALMTALRGLLRSGLPPSVAGSDPERDSMPTEFPRELLPAGTAVRLAVATATHSTVVGVSPTLTLSGIPAHLVSLTRAGWRGRAPARGFLPSADNEIRLADLCRGAEIATLEFVPVESGGFAVRAGHTRGSTAPCLAVYLETGGFSDVAVPFLFLPGVVATSASGASGRDVFDSEVRAVATAEPNALAKDLAAQFIKWGWTISTQVNVGEVTAIRGRNTSVGGEPVTALIVIAPLGAPSRIHLRLHVVRHKPVAPPRGGA